MNMDKSASLKYWSIVGILVAGFLVGAIGLLFAGENFNSHIFNLKFLTGLYVIVLVIVSALYYWYIKIKKSDKLKQTISYILNGFIAVSILEFLFSFALNDPEAGMGISIISFWVGIPLLIIFPIISLVWVKIRNLVK